MEDHMSKLYYSGLVILFVMAIIGCSKKSPQPKQTPAASVSSEFVPSTDSSLTTSQIEKWLTSNPLLDSLSYLYEDSFKTGNASKRLRYQEDYTAAQNRICLLSGFAGGYKEYCWVLQNLGNPKNKPLLDSFKVSTY